MKRITVAALAMTGLLAPAGPAAAQDAETVNMAELTCGDLEGEEDISFYVAWTDGFLRGKTGESTVAVDWFEKLADHVASACETDAERTLTAIIDGFPRN